jgi:hypothetical protein
VEHLQATFEAARSFGLSESDVLAIVSEVWSNAEPNTIAEDLRDEVSAALAARVLERERQTGRKDLDHSLPS